MLFVKHRENWPVWTRTWRFSWLIKKATVRCFLSVERNLLPLPNTLMACRLPSIKEGDAAFTGWPSPAQVSVYSAPAVPSLLWDQMGSKESAGVPLSPSIGHEAATAPSLPALPTGSSPSCLPSIQPSPQTCQHSPRESLFLPTTAKIANNI